MSKKFRLYLHKIYKNLQKYLDIQVIGSVVIVRKNRAEVEHTICPRSIVHFHIVRTL